AADDPGQRFDVLVRVKRPLGARHDPVVVEDPQRTDTELVRIAVAIEREVPASVEPAALLVPDRVRLADLDRGSQIVHDPSLRRRTVRRGSRSPGMRAAGSTA